MRDILVSTEYEIKKKFQRAENSVPEVREQYSEKNTLPITYS
jgi:hypothetical protein